MKVYVVTNPEDGRDCVAAVVKAKSEDEARAKYAAYYDIDVSELDREIFHYETVI